MIRTTQELFDCIGFPSNLDGLSDARQKIFDAQVFDFGDISDVKMGAGPAIDLWKSGMLRLPFPSVIYRFLYRGLRVYILASEVDGQLGMYQWRDDDGDLYLDIAQRFVLNDEHVSMTVTYNARDTDVHGNPIDQSALNQYVAFFGTSVIHLSMMLCTRSIGKRHEPAPAKLNKKRARSGKPPHSAVTYIDVSPYREREGSHPGSGTGIGKAPHLRRGHIRHFDDGSATWVRDCVVNIEYGPAVGRDHYAIKQEKELAHSHAKDV